MYWDSCYFCINAISYICTTILYFEVINDKFVKCCLRFMLWSDQNCDSGLTHMDSLLRYSMELIDCDWLTMPDSIDCAHWLRTQQQLHWVIVIAVVVVWCNFSLWLLFVHFLRHISMCPSRRLIYFSHN